MSLNVITVSVALVMSMLVPLTFVPFVIGPGANTSMITISSSMIGVVVLLYMIV